MASKLFINENNEIIITNVKRDLNISKNETIQNNIISDDSVLVEPCTIAKLATLLADKPTKVHYVKGSAGYDFTVMYTTDESFTKVIENIQDASNKIYESYKELVDTIKKHNNSCCLFKSKIELNDYRRVEEIHSFINSIITD